jgi:hypothetical protein
MNIFHTPDVDLLEQIYDSATVCLAPNDAENATITFNKGAAHGSTTSLSATAQYLYQRSVADAHGDWAELGHQPWFEDWQELGGQLSRRRPRLSV